MTKYLSLWELSIPRWHSKDPINTLCTGKKEDYKKQMIDVQYTSCRSTFNSSVYLGNYKYDKDVAYDLTNSIISLSHYIIY